MPKKKKTLKQKLKTEQRRQFPSIDSSLQDHSVAEDAVSPDLKEQTFSLPHSYTGNTVKTTRKVISTPMQATTIATNEYKYLGRDLLKTLFLTSSIIIVELVLRFIFERG